MLRSAHDALLRNHQSLVYTDCVGPKVFRGILWLLLWAKCYFAQTGPLQEVRLDELATADRM